MFLLLKELSPPDGLPARTHPLGRGVFNETPSLMKCFIISYIQLVRTFSMCSSISCFDDVCLIV